MPGATESATIRNDFLCNLCASSLQEDRKFRVLGGNMHLHFVITIFKVVSDISIWKLN